MIEPMPWSFPERYEPAASSSTPIDIARATYAYDGTAARLGTGSSQDRQIRDNVPGVIEKPLLLLDIDGVLNPWAAEVCPEGFQEHALFLGDDDPIRVAAVHGSWIRELESSFYVVWASAWGADSRLLGELLGLPDYPLVEFPPTPFPPRDKVSAIADYVGDRPCAWVDDEHTDEGRLWAESRSAATLLLSIDPAIGLVYGDVERLADWAAN